MESCKIQLANSLAAQRLFLRCQLDLQTLDETAVVLGGGYFEHEFAILSDLLHDDFEKTLACARVMLADIEPAMLREEQIGLELWQCREQSIRRLGRSFSKIDADVLDLLHDTQAIVLNSALQEYGAVLATERIISNSSPSCRPSFSQSIVGIQTSHLCYRSAAQALVSYVQGHLSLIQNFHFNSGYDTSLMSIPKALDLVNPFPACHIAYWNGDRQTAVDLWKEAYPLGQSDLFGRTFAHIAVEAGDLQTLSDIGAAFEDDEAIRFAGTDVRGRSLLAIAAAKGYQDAFAICIQRHADTLPYMISTGESLLEIAAKNGNKAILSMLLRYNIIHPPYLVVLRNLIEAGYHDTICEFLPVWEICIGHEVSQARDKVIDLAFLAQSHDMVDLHQLILDCLQQTLPSTMPADLPIEPLTTQQTFPAMLAHHGTDSPAMSCRSTVSSTCYGYDTMSFSTPGSGVTAVDYDSREIGVLSTSYVDLGDTTLEQLWDESAYHPCFNR